MALPRCCHSVTRSRTKLQCSRKRKRGYKWLYYCVVSCLHGGLHTFEYPVASDGTCRALAIRGRKPQVVCNGGQHIDSSNECAAALTGEGPHYLHRSFSSVHSGALSRRSRAPWSGMRPDRPRRRFGEVVFVWLRLKLGSTDRISEQPTHRQGKTPM